MSLLYAWKEDSRFSVSPDIAGAELERIREECGGGDLRASDVVNESREEDAPLHPCFTWDDAEAAEHWRENEARSLIRSIRVLAAPEEEPSKPVIAYVHKPNAERQQCYRPSREMATDEDLRDAVLEQAMAMLESFRKRFEHLGELKEVFAAIDSTAKRTRKRAKAAAG